LAAIYAHAELPPHPLVGQGFLSVGCMPCTSRTAADEDSRAGRWRGQSKTECGIHNAKTS
jgi:phosphoadenosine phosphosulfate reductase